MHTLLQAAPPDILNHTQCGIAGLMGALWWWERKYSRQREDQLTEAHTQILAKQEHLQAILDALQSNTTAITQFTQVQEEILRLLQPPTKAAA
jgi:hypothetical protein